MSADTRFWAGGQGDPRLFRLHRVLLILGWWSKYARRPAPVRLARARRALLIVYRGEAAQSAPRWLFRTGTRCLTWPSCYKEMALLHPGRPAATMPTSGWRTSISASGAPIPPSGWSASNRPCSPSPFRSSTPFSYQRYSWSPVCSGDRRRTKEFQYYAFLIALGYPGFLYRVPIGSGPRTPFSAETFAAHPVTGFVAVSDHADDARPAGIRALRLLSQRPHGTHHPGVVGQPDGVKAVVPDLFGLHSVHHFCYSLSSIPLYG